MDASLTLRLRMCLFCQAMLHNGSASAWTCFPSRATLLGGWSADLAQAQGGGAFGGRGPPGMGAHPGASFGMMGGLDGSGPMLMDLGASLRLTHQYRG